MERRRFLTAALGGLAVAPFTPLSAFADPSEACRLDLTAPNIEGPFYRPGAPLRAALGEGVDLHGFVRDSACRPLADTVIEIWQADPDGEYDLEGDGFRGILRTDAQGFYHLSTVRPGRYLNGGTYRPAHIHVKVHANRRPVLTTQLYFAGDPYNDADPWFRSELVMGTQPQGCCSIGSHGPERLRFDFVV
ncbi:MAG: hypothetical protein AB7S26_13320 [Sandaracinaceae bacterium]